MTAEGSDSCSTFDQYLCNNLVQKSKMQGLVFQHILDRVCLIFAVIGNVVRVKKITLRLFMVVLVVLQRHLK